MIRNNLDISFFKKAVHQCNDLVVVTDANASILYVNPAFERHTGYRLNKIKGKNISIVKSEAHKQSFYKKLWAEIKKGKPISKVFINKKKNGELYYENKTITPILNTNGEIENYLSTSKDITQEIKLQKEIVQQKDFIQTVVQNTDALIVGLDKKANIVLFNKACEKLTGYKSSEIIGKNVFDLFIPKEDRKRIEGIFIGVSMNEGKFRSHENVWLTNSKKRVLIKWSNTIIHDYKNEDFLVLSTGINITNERANEEKLSLLNLQLDEKVRQRTTEIEKLNHSINLKNDLLHKINTNLPAIVYILNTKTKKVKLINININEHLRFPKQQNSELDFIDFISYFSASNHKLLSLKSFCDEKLNSEFTLRINKKEIKVHNKSVGFEFDSKNKPITYLGFITDISSTKSIQKRLEESQEIAHIGTWEWNITTNDLYWSNEIYRIFELDPKEFQPSYPKFLEVIHADDRKLVENAVNDALMHNTTYEVAHRLEPRPGKIKYVIEKGYSEFNLKGEPVRMIGTVRDVTETEYIRIRLEESQKIAHIGTWERNAVTKKLYWSDEMYRILEIDRENEEPSYQRFLEIVHPEDLDYVKDALKRSSDDKSVYEITYRLIPDSGKTKYVTEKGYSQHDSSGNLSRMIGTIRDVTETEIVTKRLEESQKLAKLGTWEWDLLKDELFWSEEMNRIHGIDRGKRILDGNNLIELIHEEDRSAVVERIMAVRKKQGEFALEYRINHGSEIKHIKHTGRSELGKGGQITRIIGVLQDITDEKELKNKLKSSFIVLENSMNAIFTSDLSGKIQYANQAAIQMWGYDDLRQMLIERPMIFDYWHPDELSNIYECVGQLQIDGRFITKTPYKAVKKNNDTILVKYHAVILKNELGEAIGLSGAFFDVTEEIELKNKLQNAFIVLENSLNATFTSDLIGKIRYANNAAVKMWGFSNQEEMLHERPFAEDYWLPEEKVRVDECVKEVIQNGCYFNTEPFKAVKKNGEIALMKFNIVLIRDNDGIPISMTASFFDITEEVKHKKEIEEYDKKLDLLLGNIDEVVYGNEIIENKFLTGNVFFLSGKAKQIIGIDYNDLKRDPDLWYKQLHPDDVQLVIDSANKAILNRVSVTRLYRIKHMVSGDYIWLEDKITPEFDERGVMKYFYGSARDVTNRIEKDELLKESEEKYRLLSENNNDLITLRDANENVLFVSKSVENILGYSAEEYSQIRPIDMLHPDDYEAVKAFWFEDGTYGRKAGYVEARMKHKAGHYVWLQALTNPIYSSDGKVIKVIGSSRDITERKNLEMSIRASEVKYRSIYENALVGIFRTNIVTHRPIEVNDVCVDLFGYESKEDFLANFVASERYDSVVSRNELMTAIRESGFLENQQVAFKKKNGEMFWGNVSVKITDDGDVIEGVVIDVSQSKKYEVQLEKNLLEKDVLLKEIHHRVKNNLQVVSSLLKLQLDKINDPNAREPIMISRERIKAIALIHEKLYLSEDISTINFSDYLTSLTRPMHALNNEKNIKVTYNMIDFYTDINTAIPLGLACYEIISNAFKHAFNNSKHAELNISIVKTEVGNEIVISDSGDGFEISKLDLSRSLGWSLIENLTKQAKGDLHIQSRPKIGSEFKIIL